MGGEASGGERPMPHVPCNRPVPAPCIDCFQLRKKEKRKKKLHRRSCRAMTCVRGDVCVLQNWALDRAAIDDEFLKRRDMPNRGRTTRECRVISERQLSFQTAAAVALSLLFLDG